MRLAFPFIKLVLRGWFEMGLMRRCFGASFSWWGFGGRGLVLVGLMFLVVGCGLVPGSGGSGSSLGAGGAGVDGSASSGTGSGEGAGEGEGSAGPGSSAGEGSAGDGDGDGDGSGVGAAELDALYRAWSTPVESGSTFRVSEPKTLPVVVPEGGVTVSAFIPGGKGRGGSRTLTRDLPAGTTRERVQAVLDEFERIPWAVVDWSPPAVADSAVPNDPKWGTDELYKTDAMGQKKPAYGQAIPFSRIGLCCAPSALVDGWDLAEGAVNLSEVKIAVIDSGLIDPKQSKQLTAELSGKFVGGWDATNTGAGSSYGPGKGWGLYEMSLDGKDSHGSDVAGYAVAQADNKQGIAGAAGRLNTIKFGMFRKDPYDIDNAYYVGEAPISGGAFAALGVINRQVADYIKAKETGVQPAGYKWNIVNNSNGNLDPDKAMSRLLLELAHRGVLVIAAAGNSRGEVRSKIEEAYGENPIQFPAADPHVINVASWGGKDSVENQLGASGKPIEPDIGHLYKDMTSDFSSTSPFVDLAAPGERLPEFSVSDPAKGYIGGTSFSAPIVAGIAATLISISGDKYQCPDKPTEAARYDCVEKLRAALIGATTNIANVDENPSTQGAGVIDAPAAYLGNTAVKVPARPKMDTPVVTPENVLTSHFNLKLAWSSADAWADGSKREPAAKTSTITTYRLYVDGDPTYKVKVVGQLDKNRSEIQGAGLVDGNWKVPGTWTDYRIPRPPITKPATGNPQGSLSNQWVAAGKTITYAITEITTYLDSNGRPQRQTESMPSTLTCSRVKKGDNAKCVPYSIL